MLPTLHDRLVRAAEGLSASGTAFLPETTPLSDVPEGWAVVVVASRARRRGGGALHACSPSRTLCRASTLYPRSATLSTPT